MKVQMKFQKILTLVSLVVAALTLVFAVSYLSGGISDLKYYIYENIEIDFGGVDDFYNISQAFVSGLVYLSIAFILSVVFLYITGTNSRRNYYITNYVALGIYFAIGVTIVLYTLINLFLVISSLNSIDWAALEEYYNLPDIGGAALGYPTYEKNLTTTIIGFVLVVVVMANLVVWALNFVWKLKLMKGEKALLEQGLVKEVA